MSFHRALAIGNTIDPMLFEGDGGRFGMSMGTALFTEHSETGVLVEPARVISHPGFAQVEGQGIYTYPENPDLTTNYARGIATKMESVATRTLGTTVLAQKQQQGEDVVIRELWLAEANRLSTLSEMFRLFLAYMQQPLGPGEFIGWMPLGDTASRLLVKIEDVQLGGINEFEYRELRENALDADPSWLDRSLTVTWRTQKDVTPPRGVITVEGL